MPDKKLTDSEIVKALECCARPLPHCYCDECPAGANGGCAIKTENIIDLINRLQEEKEALINGQETLQKYIADLQAENERLTTERDNEHRCYLHICEDLKQAVNRNITAKAEAYKEFAERLKEYIDTHEHLSCEECECVPISKDGLDNFLKEMVGDK